MSVRVDSSPLITGAVVVGVPGLGVLAESVPSTGEHGAGYLYASLEFPEDAGKEVRGLITTWPTLGELIAFEDSSFEYDGPTDLFAFQMYVDGVAVGTPQTVTVTVGAGISDYLSATESGSDTFAASGALIVAGELEATPDSALSAAIKEAYASAPTDTVILHTLELRHPDFVAPIRVVNDHANLTATLEATAPVNPGAAVEFIRFAFRFTLPELMTTGMPEIEIEIDNVDASIVAYMDAAAQSDQLIEVTYRPYLSTDLSAPQMDPPLTLVLHDVECDVFAIRGRASFGDFANYRFPTETYDQERFPGLVG